jgi:hypothetical protein
MLRSPCCVDSSESREGELALPPLLFLVARMAQGWAEGNAVHGATVDRIPLERFPDFSVCLPALHVQEKIVNVLSAYDDLIENDQQADCRCWRSRRGYSFTSGSSASVSPAMNTRDRQWHA